MLLVYSEKTSKRQKYIFEYLLGKLLGLEYKFTTDPASYLSWQGPGINYSRQDLGKGLFFPGGKFLFENGIHKQKLTVKDYKNTKVIFPFDEETASLPFDIFAASFYMLSRYEEYLPHFKDIHGRFPASESIAYKKKFLQQPVVNIWTKSLKECLVKLWPDIIFREPVFKCIPSIDIDSAYAYRLKGFIRTLGGYAKDLFKLDFEKIGERSKVLLGLQPDPFDSFDYILRLQQSLGLKHLFFILLGNYGTYDKNLPVSGRKFHILIKSLGDYSEIGIHPSYAAANDLKKLSEETARLSRILNKEITKSRQHFIKLKLPFSYHNLINMDIQEDYSMGFPDQPGFRAGVCTPFNFYDLELENPTPLIIHPFTVMDGSLKDYLKLNNNDALSLLLQLVDEVKAVGGEFISLWHNESLGGKGRWKGWKDIYEEMLTYAVQRSKDEEGK